MGETIQLSSHAITTAMPTGIKLMRYHAMKIRGTGIHRDIIVYTYWSWTEGGGHGGSFIGISIGSSISLASPLRSASAVDVIDTRSATSLSVGLALWSAWSSIQYDFPLAGLFIITCGTQQHSRNTKHQYIATAARWFTDNDEIRTLQSSVVGNY